ncbi:MAG: hypothetical protein JKY56_01505 [Kofleriaceae bacterium]|nr:hypothetical protein [Kofleriaceae bacterium]
MRSLLGIFLCVSLVGCQGDESTFDPFEPTWCELVLERNDEGFFSQIRYLTYNDNGDMIQMDWDYQNDGDIDLRFYQEFDKDNYLIRFQKVPVGVGTGLEFSETFENDSKGRILIYSRDDEDDGVIDFVRTNTWGSHGLTLSEYDDDVDGTVDRSARYIYEGDRLLRRESFSPGSEESPYAILNYLYEDGLLVSAIGTYVGTDDVWYEASWTYDSDRRINGTVVAGIPTTYVYDEEGRLAESTRQGSALKLRSVYRYTCEERTQQSANIASGPDIHDRPGLGGAPDLHLRLDGRGEGLVGRP